MGILCPSVAYRVCREFFVIKLLWRAVGSIPTPAIGVGRDERAAGDEVVRGMGQHREAAAVQRACCGALLTRSTSAKP